MNTPPATSLDGLEGATAPETPAESVLIATLRHHRRTPVERLGTEALRFLLEEGQSVGTVLRIALDRLETDPFQAGDFHPGDLLVTVLQRPATTWNAHPELRARAFALVADVEAQLPRLEQSDRAAVAKSIRGFQNLWLTWS